MALTGLQIQKLLPKTNCKECGSNTCLAFAMKLAAKKAELSECPYASDEAKAVLGAASEPPVKAFALGKDKNVKLGGETVFYRHEKTFVSPTAFAININDTDSAESIDIILTSVKDYVLERVGELLYIDMVCVTQKQSDPDVFASVVRKALDITGKPVVVNAYDINASLKAAIAIKGSNSLLVPPDTASIHDIRKIAETNEHAMAVTAPDINTLVSLTSELKEKGFNNLVLNVSTLSLAERFQINSIARKSALRNSYKPLGYPTIYFVESDDVQDTTVSGVTEIVKYGGICVLKFFNKALLSSLFTLRLNIYTDPQKPIQVEPKVYPIGEPNANSPVFVTTNFSLTYFIVSGEIENAGISAWLIVPECEGMSVLTAWAAGKFSGASIGKFIKECGIEQSVSTRQIVIPGYISQISGELEESIPGWKVLIGPQEAGDLESFIKSKLVN
jgi:acetyl-CoA decarbonylase/synthase complex subunit gamma